MQTSLPPNFQEIMVSSELDLKKEISEETIRKLIYIYTLGMQYYNIYENNQFENYYRERLNNLLLNPTIINYLDKNKVDLSKDVELKLFPGFDLSQIQQSGSINELHKIRKKIQVSEDELLLIIRKKIHAVDLKLKEIEGKVANNIVEQMSLFEERKRKQKIKKINNRPAATERRQSKFDQALAVLNIKVMNVDRKSSEDKENDSEKSIEKEKSGNRKTSFSNSSDDEGDEMNMKIEELKINDEIYKRRGSSIGQTKMLKEIEECVEKNMKDMYNAQEELKKSYEGEIKEAEESGIDEIADSLKEDLKNELAQLALEYEEERFKMVDAIKAKYA